MGSVREFYDEISSTQDRALELARSGAAEGTTVVARRQTLGRGRHGHRWEAPEGGLYLSIVLSSPSPAEPLLPLALGAGLAETFGDGANSPIRVKWPNDVLVVPPVGRSRKLAGILVDRIPSPTLESAAVAGIGVNVSVDPGSYPRSMASSIVGLAELISPAPTLELVERNVVSTVLETVERLRDPSGRAETLGLCRRLLWGVGLPAEIDGRPVGRIVALGEAGELWVEEDGDRVPIRAGDLRVVEPS